MTACGPPAGGILNILAPGGGPGHTSACGGSADDVVLDENPPGSSERSGLLREASVHSQVAIQVSEFMQGNAARAEDLRQRLAAHGGAQPGAVLTREIKTMAGSSPGRSRPSIGTLPRPGGSASRPPGLAGRKALPSARQRTGQSRLRQQQHRKGSRAAAVTGKGP
jgi:hypothetical protein